MGSELFTWRESSPVLGGTASADEAYLRGLPQVEPARLISDGRKPELPA